MTEEIHVAFAVDRGYLNQAAVTMASIIANTATPDAVRFHILHDEDEGWITQPVARWSISRPNTVRVKSPFASYNAKPGSSWTTAMLLRLSLPLALSSLDRVIYLDADTIVLRDIAELWRTDLGEASAGGVVDLGVALLLGRGDVYKSYAHRDHLYSLGLDPKQPTYVNSGVVLFDLGKLRGLEFTRLALEMDLARRDELRYVDQDIINSVLRDRMFLLDPRWNVHSQVMSRSLSRRHHYIPDILQPDLALQRSEQWVIHYTGPKPWSSWEAWHGDIWWQYASLTGLEWPRPAKVKSSMLRDMRDGWLDLSSQYSILRHKLRKARHTSRREK